MLLPESHICFTFLRKRGCAPGCVTPALHGCGSIPFLFLGSRPLLSLCTALNVEQQLCWEPSSAAWPAASWVCKCSFPGAPRAPSGLSLLLGGGVWPGREAGSLSQVSLCDSVSPGQCPSQRHRSPTKFAEGFREDIFDTF